eukprot:2597069-Rhodomonas_salina.1
MLRTETEFAGNSEFDVAMVTTRSAQDGDDASPHRSQSGSRSRKPVRRRAADSGSEDDDESEEEEVK